MPLKAWKDKWNNDPKERKVRTVYNKDGSIAVVHPAPNSRTENQTEEEWLAWVYEKNKCWQGDDVDGWDDMTYDELPERGDEAQRTAWERHPSGRGVVVNQVKAAEVREQREAAFLIAETMKEMSLERLKAEGKVPAHVELPNPLG